MFNDLDRNACALIACILNPKLTRRQALSRMEVVELPKENFIKIKSNLILIPAVVEDIKNLYLVKGLNAREIGEIYNVPIQSIYLFLHKNNVQVRTRTDAYRKFTT